MGTAADTCQFFYTTSQELYDEIFLLVWRVTGWSLEWVAGWMSSPIDLSRWVNYKAPNKRWTAQQELEVQRTIRGYFAYYHKDLAVQEFVLGLPYVWTEAKKLLYISAVLEIPGAVKG